MLRAFQTDFNVVDTDSNVDQGVREHEFRGSEGPRPAAEEPSPGRSSRCEGLLGPMTSANDCAVNPDRMGVGRERNHRRPMRTPVREVAGGGGAVPWGRSCCSSSSANDGCDWAKGRTLRPTGSQAQPRKRPLSTLFCAVTLRALRPVEGAFHLRHEGVSQVGRFVVPFATPRGDARRDRRGATRPRSWPPLFNPPCTNALEESRCGSVSDRRQQ